MNTKTNEFITSIVKNYMIGEMSDISEDHWAAGWLEGTAKTLWRAALKYPDPYNWGLRDISLDRIRDLIKMALHLGEWYDGEKWISLKEWEKENGMLKRQP